MTDWKMVDHTSSSKGYIKITDGNGGNVCDIFPFGAVGGLGLEKARENARKIVNADQLYDALIDMIAWCEEGCPEGSYGTLSEAKAAIKMILVEPR